MIKENKPPILAPSGNSTKISTRIFTLVAFCLGLFALVSGISIWQMYKISVDIGEITKREIPLTRDLTEITIHQLEQAIKFERALRAGEAMNKHTGAKEEFDKTVRTFKGLTGVIKTEFDEVKVIARRALDATISTEERQEYQSLLTMLDKLDAEHEDYDRLSRKAFKLIDAGKLEQALVLLPRIEAEEQELDRQLEKMLLEVESFTAREMNEIDKHEQLALILLVSITGIALIAGTIVAVFMVRRSISRPLSEIVTGLEALGSDDMSVEVKVYSDDEIGAVAKAYAVFKATLIKLKEREAELVASLRFKTLVESTNVVPWEFDPASMRYTYIGPQAVELFGYPLEDWYTEDFFANMIHPDDREDAINFCMSATKACRDHDFEYRALTADGRIIWVRDVVSVVAENGEAKGLRGVLIDITEKKNSEAALRESEQRFKDIAEVSSDWIWECDENLRITNVSERFAQVSGVPIEQVLGKTRHEIGKEAIADWESHLADLEARRPFRDFSYSVKDENGEARHWVISGRPVFDANGSFKGYRGTGSDRTKEVCVQAELVRHRDHLQELVDNATQELKAKAEALKEALAKEVKLSKLQREFVTMASHEFRTPLAIIDATAQRMKSQADKNRLTPTDAVERVEKIRDAVRRMTRLMESTLTAARMEEGKIEIEIKPCDIGNVVREVCKRQQEIAKTHVISCDLANLPATIQADAGSLELVLTNLLSNAVKYAPDAPDIEVMAHTDAHQVVISVRDHGIGIDEDDLDKVGDRFFRAKTSTGIVGTGIGLNLAKTLVGMHDGSLNAVSKKGKGSTFTICLPIAGPEQTGQAETKVA